jgi:hypothetical protein
MMSRSLLCLAILSLGAFATTVEADPLLSFGPDIPLFVTATASVRRDSNVFLSSAERQSDTIYLITPGLSFQWTGAASLSISASEQFSRYATNRELDDHLADINSSFAYNGANSKLGLSASYQEEDQSSLQVQSSDQTLKHSLAFVSATGEVNMAPKTSASLGVTFDRTVYPQAGFIDSDLWSVPVNLYYAMTPKTDLSVGYSYQKTREDSGIGNSKGDFYNIGARGEFTPKLSGQVQVGVSDYRPDGGPKSRSLGLNANLDYAFSPKTTIVLSGSSGFSTSPLGTGEKNASVGVSVNTKLSEQWALSLGGSYLSSNYLITPIRKDEFWVGDVSLSYIWTTNISFQLDYIYRTNHSTLPYAMFDDDVVTFSVASKF